MVASHKQDVVTKLLSHITQHKDDLGASDYAEMTTFLMAQFGKEMPLFKVTYAKLRRDGDKHRHVRKTKLVCAAEHTTDIVVPTESECMHGIRFTQSDGGRTVVHFDDAPERSHHERTLIHVQRVG